MAVLRSLRADDHEIVHRGVRLLLGARADWHVCGEAADGLAAVDQCK